MQKTHKSTNYILRPNQLNDVIPTCTSLEKCRFNMIIRSSTTTQCVVQDRNTINITVLVILIFISLTHIEPEVELLGFCTWPLNYIYIIVRRKLFPNLNYILDIMYKEVKDIIIMLGRDEK